MRLGLVAGVVTWLVLASSARAQSSNASGTVVIVSPDDSAHLGGLYATIRTAGGRFAPQQQLVTWDTAGHNLGDVVDLTVGPIAADGTVAVSWPWYGPAGSIDEGRVVRTADAAGFGPAAVVAPESPDLTRLSLDDSRSAHRAGRRDSRSCPPRHAVAG